VSESTQQTSITLPNSRIHSLVESNILQYTFEEVTVFPSPTTQKGPTEIGLVSIPSNSPQRTSHSKSQDIYKTIMMANVRDIRRTQVCMLASTFEAILVPEALPLVG